MKFKIIVAVFSLIVVVASCGKDKFQTKPTLTIKGINSKVIGPGETLSIRIGYTDKEGDLSQDTLLSIVNRLNRRPLPANLNKVDTLHNIIPKFPEKSTGEFEVKFEWAQDLHESDIENDTIMFKFVAKDRKGNVSDTVSTDRIVVLYR